MMKLFSERQLWYANFEAMNTVKSSVLSNHKCYFESYPYWNCNKTDMSAVTI